MLFTTLFKSVQSSTHPEAVIPRQKPLPARIKLPDHCTSNGYCGFVVPIATFHPVSYITELVIPVQPLINLVI